MSADATALKALLERVENASGPDREIDAAIEIIEPDLGARIKPARYTASIDAALALVERVLPGAVWERDSEGAVTLWHDFGSPSYFMPYRAEENQDVEPADNSAVPRTILSALLRARLAQIGADHDR